jgi:very-short-patch-repair endonuclease
MTGTTSTLLSLLFFGVLLALLIAIVVLLATLLRRPRRAARTQHAPGWHASPARQPASTTTRLPYARAPQVLTDAERVFYEALLQATPSNLVIFAQVRLANLVHTTERRPRQRKYDFFRIQAKCVDFVLCDADSTAPRLVVELDDASHQRQHRRERDAFVDAVLAATGLPILHVPWQRSYDVADLAHRVRALLGVLEDAPPAPPSIPDVPAVAAPAFAPQRANEAMVPAPPQRELRWACGQCHREVSPRAKYCTHCGAILELA